MREWRDIEPTSASEDTIVPSGRNVIVTIGIDRYLGWPALDNAVSDARGALDAFGRLGFENIRPPLLNEEATAEAIHCLVTDDLKTLGSDDSLILFFAGHGHTQTRWLPAGPVQTGYIVPFDGERADGRAARWLRIDSWLNDIARIPARHILVILDACRSGVALDSPPKWRGGVLAQPSPALDELRRRQSRRVITSALGNQRAMDCGPALGHSLFTGYLIEGLTSGLAQDGRLEATGTELGTYVQRCVTRFTGSQQTPSFGPFLHDDCGEIFIPLTARGPEKLGAGSGSELRVTQSSNEEQEIPPQLEATERPGVYFSSADRQAMRFQDGGAIRRTLLLALLFQKKLVIPDIFFFICPDFLDLTKDRNSLLSAGLERGLIQPAFREAADREQPFGHALSLIEKQKILGLVEESDRRLIAKLLDKRVGSAIASNCYAPIKWAPNTSTEYANCLRDHLIREEPVGPTCSTSAQFRKVWDQTAKWRIECLTEALATSVDLRHGGVRRGEIMKVIGNHLGLPRGKEIEDVGQLLDAESRDIGPGQRDALWHFVRWINECYYINQAKACGSALPLMPSYHPLSTCVTAPEMPVPKTPTVALKLELGLPSVDYLLQVPGSKILEIRAAQEEHGDYFTALEYWQANSRDGAAKDFLTERALQYAREVTEGTRPPRDHNGHVQASIGTGAMGDALDWLLGKLPSIGFVAPAGWALYRWLPERRVNTSVIVETVEHDASPPKGSNALVLPSAGEPKDASRTSTTVPR